MLLTGFVVLTLAWTAISLGLSWRQTQHVDRHRATVPADFAGTVSLEDHQKAADYTVARERVARLEAVVEAGIALGWVFGGIGLLYGGLAAVMGPSLGRGVAFLIGTTVVGTLVNLPFAVYRTFVLEQRFGFNRGTPATFIKDLLKGWLIGLVVAVPLAFAALWAMTTLQGFWWLWVWFALLVLMAVAPAVYVRLIAPRFNTFTPLGDPSLRERIEALLARSGFRSSGLFTMDASRRTAHGNAYFIGFGRTKRIVLFDTLLSRSTPAEVEAVIAHELGHFKHRHVIYGLVRAAVMLFLVLAAFGWLAPQPWLLPAFHVADRDPALQLFVCLLLSSAVTPILGPISNWISRRNEFEADAYARQAVGAEPMIDALTGLARDNAATLTPDPVYAVAHYSHPPVPIRIRQLRADALAAR